MKRLFLAAAAASLVVACSIPRQAKEGGALPGQHVDPTQRVLVLAIKDGQEQGEPVAAGSGQGLVDALRRALAAHQVPLSATPDMALEQGFADAERGGFTYVLKGTITHWEDNATAWSGKGDKLNISAELYDVRSRTLVAADWRVRGLVWCAAGQRLAGTVVEHAAADTDRGAEVLPDPEGLAKPRVLGLQPAAMELLQLLGRDRMQGRFDNARQFRPWRCFAGSC